MSEPVRQSLIVSMFNQRQFAPVVLAAIRDQKVDRPFEVIVCDDGSSDGVLHELADWAETASIDLRYIWQPDSGFRLARSRNNAIRCAQGEVLVFLDGDTWVSPDFLESHWQAHEAGSALVCGMRRRLTVASPDLQGRWRDAVHAAQAEPDPEPVTWQRHWLSTNRPWMACVGGNFSIRAEHGLRFDERFEGWGSEDRDFAIRAYQLGCLPRALPLNAVHLRIRGQADKVWTHDAVVASLRGKSLLRAKYPGDTMAHSLALARRSYLDEPTGQWRVGPTRADVTADDVLDQFESWCDSQGLDVPWRP